MPDYNWTCLGCDKAVAAGLGACDGCGCPSDISGQELERWRSGTTGGLANRAPRKNFSQAGRRPDGSNIIPFDELFTAVVYAPLLFWLAWKFFRDETAVFSFSRRAKAVVEVSGLFSSILGAMAALAGASLFASIVLDHFDRRKNEHLYETARSNLGIFWFLLMLLSMFIGWQFEHIRMVKV